MLGASLKAQECKWLFSQLIVLLGLYRRVRAAPFDAEPNREKGVQCEIPRQSVLVTCAFVLVDGSIPWQRVKANNKLTINNAKERNSQSMTPEAHSGFGKLGCQKKHRNLWLAFVFDTSFHPPQNMASVRESVPFPQGYINLSVPTTCTNIPFI